MSLAVLYSRALSGMDAPEVVVEVHLANGLPMFLSISSSGEFLTNSLILLDKSLIKVELNMIIPLH